MESKRIYWVDIFKAIAIILVVIGHSTGMFNAYIYQFHVASFFFISGWVSKMNEDCFGKDIYKKIMGLIVPVLTMILINGFILKILNLTGIYELFYNTELVPGITDMYQNFFMTGSMIDILGAAWFLVVLFEASLLSHLNYIISGKTRWLFLLITFGMYFLGYFNMKQEAYSSNIDRALLAQGYYGTAFVLKNICNDKTFKKINNVMPFGLIFLATSAFMYLIKTYVKANSLMDLASRQIDNIGWSTLAVANGILWIYSLSKIISFVHLNRFKKILTFIGKNSMGIMFLHFWCFRGVAFCLYTLKVIPADECARLVPSTDIGNKFWWLYTISSITVSLLIWTILSKLPYISCLLGMNKSLVNVIPTLEPCKQFAILYHNISDVFANGLKDYIRDLQLSKYKIIGYIFVSVALILLCSSARLAPRYNENKDTIEGTISVNFPYSGNSVDFGEGWLPQTDVEDYRWVSAESEFTVYLGDQSKIKLTGYIPMGIDGLTKMQFYVNEKLVIENNVQEDNLLSIEIDFEDFKVEGKNIFKIVFDGVHIPKAGEADQRSFSAMFNSILIE